MSGTTFTRAVSTTPHVSVSVNRSPTITVLLSVFHQHRIGSASTSPGGTGRGAAGAAGRTGGRAGRGGPPPRAGSCAAAAAASATPPMTAIIRTIGLLTSISSDYLLHLSKPPLVRELDERRFHLPAIQADANDVQVGLARQPRDVLLP